jgi:hypothetical protein
LDATLGDSRARPDDAAMVSLATALDEIELRLSALQSWAYDAWIGIKPSRFGVLAVAILGFVLFEGMTGQGQDALVEYAGSATREEQERLVVLYFFTFAFGVLVWGFCRMSSRLRFRSELIILRRYRLYFPSPRHAGDPLTYARLRVRRILAFRLWTPPALGTLVPILLGTAFLAAGRFERVALNAAVCLAIAALLLASFMLGQSPRALAAVRAMVPAAAPAVRDLVEPRRSTSVPSNLGWPAWVGSIAAVVIVIASVVYAGFRPISFGEGFGAVPVLYLALTVILAFGTGLAMAARLTNAPVFTLVLVVALIANSIWSGHRMRFVGAEARAPVSTDGWRPGDPHGRKRPIEAAETFAAMRESGTKKPLILVATAGGGSRAAFWTGTVLGKLHDDTDARFTDHVFAISGVSGGSLGALFYRAAINAPPRADAKLEPMLQLAVDRDFLSPALAAMFTRDMVFATEDRAAIIEQTWEASFAHACARASRNPPDCLRSLSGGFLDLWRDKQRPWPALLLNGTVVETGARSVVSNLRLACLDGETACRARFVDVADLLAANPRDLVASSAANASARFPVVGPAARVAVFDTTLKSANGGVRKPDRSVVDGGYFDNFGGVTLLQLMDEIEPVLRRDDVLPIVIQITSNASLPPLTAAADGRLLPGDEEPGGHQVLEPLQTIANIRGATGTQTRAALAARAHRLDGVYVHFRLCKQVDGRRGAPLAWVLSAESQGELKSMTDRDYETCPNKAAFAAVRECLANPVPGCASTYAASGVDALKPGR